QGEWSEIEGLKQGFDGVTHSGISLKSVLAEKLFGDFADRLHPLPPRLFERRHFRGIGAEGEDMGGAIRQAVQQRGNHLFWVENAGNIDVVVAPESRCIHGRADTGEHIATLILQLGPEALRQIQVEGLGATVYRNPRRSEEHTSELQSRENLVCRLLLEK